MQFARAQHEYLALPLPLLLGLHICPAPLSFAWGAESTYMAGYTASKGRDYAALGTVASLQRRHNPALAILVGQADQLLCQPLKLLLLNANVSAHTLKTWRGMAGKYKTQLSISCLPLAPRCCLLTNTLTTLTAQLLPAVAGRCSNIAEKWSQ